MQTFDVTFKQNGQEASRVIEGWVQLGQLLTSLNNVALSGEQLIAEVNVKEAAAPKTK